MAREPVNRAASVKDRLLNLARRDGRVFDVVLVRYALERLLYRLSLSRHRDRFVLKGGMLVTIWLPGDNRETRDADFLGYGDAGEATIRATFAEIMAIASDDGLRFDIDNMTVATIRDDMEYGGIRLRVPAYLERTRIPMVIDIGFGDALPAPPGELDYPTLLDMEVPRIRSYPLATVIAEKFQAMVALGIGNGRMKDYYDLWALPQAMPIAADELDAAIRATFERRRTDIPRERPPGLSPELVDDETKQRQWRAYAASIELEGVSLAEVVEAIWTLVGPSCLRLAGS
ncbi:nucleotidyl transferase AbiEii/AbiGii toxin family protein [Sphingomonas canadensis]|uniref:Nucleotidyl transferase AbiEii/AbiGii toxin family protein n=1 Tax=Sphingomonas canadensis TaxID=1219257 RepID=A0ABW3H0P1_9SPHN|nr:nucleotidyl transferase AbiEii/AbiGii toxin family protein [Sphingomonas canadensis]MCW3835069.1 nucleotidyl transferase AbiEii/AbiGii toxin family protein [Sphingomonas canadensis]